MERKRKVYGRKARIRALLAALRHSEDLPDMCIDMMYAVMLSF